MKCKLRESRRGNSKTCLSTLMSSYKYCATKRGYVFELTKEQFARLTKQNCFYCGQKPAQIGYNYSYKARERAYYIYNGVDRVDNGVGYVETNCIPCCGRCNRMKHTLHAEDFIEHIRKIAHNLDTS